ncbi:MAG: fibrobacter succinogenes major paralogous domain-containing protein [Daejeonella sp.]
MKTKQFYPYSLTNSSLYSFFKRPLIFTLLATILMTVSCKKDIDPAVTVPATVDYNDFTYHTIKIGEQVWMVENLRTTKYNDGITPIPLATISQQWSDPTGAYAPYLPEPEDNTKTYGLLYSWYAVSKNLAPKGWHIPTREDWNQLRTNLGGKEKAGKAMKEKDFEHWDDFSNGAFNGSNSSKFTALPGGIRGNSFILIRKNAYFWSATTYSDTEAYGNILSSSTDSFDESSAINKKSGLSVRCIMDEPAK